MTALVNSVRTATDPDNKTKQVTGKYTFFQVHMHEHAHTHICTRKWTARDEEREKVCVSFGMELIISM